MRKALQKAVLIVFCVALGFGLIGFLYGRFVVSRTGVDWWLPEDLTDRNAFITVGSIHNFSYLGGLAGLISGIFFLLRRNIAGKEASRDRHRSVAHRSPFS